MIKPMANPALRGIILQFQHTPDTPIELFEILDQQRKRLCEAKEKFGDYISPEKFEW